MAAIKKPAGSSKPKKKKAPVWRDKPFSEEMDAVNKSHIRREKAKAEAAKAAKRKAASSKAAKAKKKKPPSKKWEQILPKKKPLKKTKK
jgi:hypothetical protein|tara:strand:+ start:461 stop:727 length:267 start_codon:yes stop_codon:yes gene_type:complete